MQGGYDPNNLPSLRDFLDSLPKKPCPKKLPEEYCKLCNRLNGDVAARCKAGEVSITADKKEFMKVKEIKPVREEKKKKTEPSRMKRGKLSILEGPEYDEGLVLEVTPSKKVIELLKAKERDLPKFKAVKEGAKKPGLVPQKPKPFVPLSEWKKTAKPRKKSMYVPPPPEKRPEKEPLFRTPGSLLTKEETFFTVADDEAPMTFQTEEVCPDCGMIIPIGDNRCSGCGYEIPRAEDVGFQIMEEEETSFQIFDEDSDAIVVEAEIVEVEPEIVDASGESSAFPKEEKDTIEELFEKTKGDEPVFKMVLEGEAEKPAAKESGRECPDCGLTIPMDSEFCHHCGFKIETPPKKTEMPLKTKLKTRKKVRKAKVKKTAEKREEVRVKDQETIEEKGTPSEPMGMEPEGAPPKKREIQFKVRPKIRKKVKKADAKKIPEEKEEIAVKEAEPEKEITTPLEDTLEARPEHEEISEETKSELTAEKDEDLMMGLMEEPRLKRKMPSPEPVEIGAEVSTSKEPGGKEIELEGKDEEWLSILQEGLEEIEEGSDEKASQATPKTEEMSGEKGLELVIEDEGKLEVDEEKTEDILKEEESKGLPPKEEISFAIEGEKTIETEKPETAKAEPVISEEREAEEKEEEEEETKLFKTKKKKKRRKLKKKKK